MKVGDLKKILSVVNDDVDISLMVYRDGRLDSKCGLSSVEIEGEYEEISWINLKGYFDNKKSDS